MPSRIDITGQRYGRVIVLGDGPRNRNRRSVRCLCDCGTEFVCDPRGLTVGHTNSCGCYHRDAVSAASQAQGTHYDARSVEYNTWIKMRGRCSNPADRKYVDYGGRGIKVCERWANDYEAFLADMGRRPPDCSSIDRIDVNGGYEPSNCRWATPKLQSRNKRHHRFVEHEGRSIPLSEACEALGLNYRSALWRLNTGKSWLPAPPRDEVA